MHGIIGKTVANVEINAASDELKLTMDDGSVKYLKTTDGAEITDVQLATLPAEIRDITVTGTQVELENGAMIKVYTASLNTNNGEVLIEYGGESGGGLLTVNDSTESTFGPLP